MQERRVNSRQVTKPFETKMLISRTGAPSSVMFGLGRGEKTVVSGTPKL